MSDGRPIDPAVHRARAVVGLYGDPTVSWSIGLDVAFTSPYDVQRLLESCSALFATERELGPSPTPVMFADADAHATLRKALDDRYGDHDPLVRLAYAEDARRLIVAAHHGVLDGLGLLALLGKLVDGDVVSSARGIGDRVSSESFARSSLARLGEAIVRPPTRPAGSAPNGARARAEGGDVVSRQDVAPSRATTARAITAAGEAIVEWNYRHGARSTNIVAAVGASRRDGSAAKPDRHTAYLRLRLPDPPRLNEVRQILETTDPEPTFPERPASRVSRAVTRALRGRLGSSFLVSNLGLVTVPTGLQRIAFYPSAAGPRALAVGVTSTPSFTTVTVRMPRLDFDEAAAAELCTAIAGRVESGWPAQ